MEDQIKEDESEKKSKEEDIAVIDQEKFEKLQSARRAYERARQELPILEYELHRTFDEVLQAQQPSPFGFTPYGSGLMPPTPPADNNDIEKEDSKKKD